MILTNINSFKDPSFSRRNRIARLIWQIVWLILFRPTPPQMHSWRCFLLRIFGAKIHHSCHVYSSVEIWAPWHLSMEPESGLGPKVICYSMAPVSIGERVVISQGVHLCTGSHDYESRNFQLFAMPIRIGADAWVCAEAFIGPGVSIENGAVIGARSVVMHDQGAWMVCAGNACREFTPRLVEIEV